MNVTIFGMGYVRCVTAACLGNEGHEVTGIDSDSNKVNLVNSAQSPIMETGLDELLQKLIGDGRLRAATRCESLGDISMVCVGTPSNDNGFQGMRGYRPIVKDD
jgi:GDP-mannose 6-dehydrogenase